MLVGALSVAAVATWINNHGLADFIDAISLATYLATCNISIHFQSIENFREIIWTVEMELKWNAAI